MKGKPQIQKQELKATDQDQLIGHGQRPRSLIMCWMDFESHAAKNRRKQTFNDICVLLEELGE